MSDVYLHRIFSLFTQTVMIFAHISQLHPTLLLAFIAQVKLIALFIFFLVVLLDSFAVYGMLRLQFVRHLFRRLFLFGLFWFLTKSSHIWLCLIGRVLLLVFYRLSFNCRGLWISWLGWVRVLCSFCWFLFRLLLLRFVFGRYRVENSRWFDFFLVVSKYGYFNRFLFILFQPFAGILQLRMQTSPIISIRLQNSFNKIERYLQFRLLLFNFIIRHNSQSVSILLTHAVSDRSLIMSLLDESLLLFLPHTQLL